MVSRRFGQYTELSSEQIELLTIVFNHSKLSQYELTMKLNKEQSIVSRWIKKLCKLGYLKSVQNKTDLRCKDIILTEKSRLLIQQIINSRVELIEARCHGLTEEDIQRFKILLMKVAGRYQYN